MPWEVGTNTQEKTKETLVDFFNTVYSIEPWKTLVGPKGVKPIVEGQNPPSQLHILITELGAREPWTMSEDGIKFFWEEEWTFQLDVRVADTDLTIPDEKIQKVKVKTVGDDSKIIEQVTNTSQHASHTINIVKTVFNLPNWYNYLCHIGIHNPRLFDEREMYRGTQYQNPFRLVFNTYVFIN